MKGKGMETSDTSQVGVDIFDELVSGIEERKRLSEQILRSPEDPGSQEDQNPQMDERAARMFKVFADRSFNDTVYTQQMRFALIMWVVRNKIVNDVKRLVDVLISLVALPLAMPIMIVTAIAIKLDSHGPVFFMQNRVGKWGKPFKCYKFRSMYVDAEARKAELMHLNEADEIVFKIADDPRVTRVGRIIRKLSIDEVPQIFNVLRGEMSWVGPRPPVPSEVAQYAYDQMMRLTVTPGITGLQQVSGRSTLSFNRWIELDLEYIQQQSLAKDIEILVKTIPAVISGKGAF
jgi:exopolysaccharide biosynthesis polyprenyl glycosylphosphotransferase